MRNSGKRIVLIDVRSNAEFEEKLIPEALNFPVEEIEAGNFPHQIDKDAIVVTACGKGGGRSERAAGYLRENTDFDSYFLEGGTFGWFGEY
jgi:rhodanese-related sulfurtransferase